jgi:uncharacterized 2Fe-2S/4Fe-4S cluster protein (DUF4445 family)
MVDGPFHVKFMPSGRKVRVPAGASLSLAAHDADLTIDSSCGGRGKCGKCCARVIEGTVSEPTAAEKNLFSDEELRLGRILLCQRTVLSDCTIEIDQAGSAEDACLFHKEIFLEPPENIDSPFSKIVMKMSPPTGEDSKADLERILEPLHGNVKIDMDLLPGIPRILRQSGFRPTLVLFQEELIGLEAGDTTPEAYGIAFDIGTTTVAGYLADLATGKVLSSASEANRQARHGADVISRITYANQKPESVREMQALVADTVTSLIDRLLTACHVHVENLYGLVFTGNTVMMHFLLATSPENIATAPFTPVFTRSLTGKADHLGLQNLPPHIRFITLPNIAGYVGADTVSVMLATRIHERPGNWLAIDIGTNGEVVLSSNGRLLTCSTAAGPAFEGGCISQGMRAVPGAVYKVDFKEDPICSVIGDGEAGGLCGSGLLDAVAEMVKTGILHKSGRIQNPDQCPASLDGSLRERIEITESGSRFVLVNRKRKVAVTQKDIREVQLAKGAIRAGIEILLKEAGITASDLDGVLLAGAFGNNLRPESMEGIGMIPEVPMNIITPVGNAAGAGAVMALLSKSDLELASSLASRTAHIELSLSKDFQKIFLTAIDFGRGSDS